MQIRVLKVRRKALEMAGDRRVKIHDTGVMNTFIEYRVVLMNDDGTGMTINTIEDSRVRGQSREEDAMSYARGLAKHLGLDTSFLIETVEERQRNMTVLVDPATGEQVYA